MNRNIEQLKSLPDDMLIEIMRKLPVDDLKNLCCLNKYFYGFCKEKEILKKVIKYYFNVDIINPTFDDYRFLELINSISYTSIPQNKELEDRINRFIDQAIDEEYQAC